MNFEKLIESMCYTYRHDFGLLKPNEQEPIRRQMRQLVDNDVKYFLNKKRCSNCVHYTNGTKTFKDRFVCEAIDDKYTQHYGGYFMPPPEFECSFWIEKK